MSELSQEARSLIDNNLTCDDPSAADRMRMRSKLTTQLGAAAFAGAVVTMTSVSASTGSGLGASSAASGGTLHLASVSTLMKSVMAAGLASVIGVTAWLNQAPTSVDPTGTSAGRALLATPSETASDRPSPEPVLELSPQVESLADDETVRESLAKAPSNAPSSRRAQSAEANSLSAELALLAKAQDALRNENPTLALKLAGDHKRSYPRGALRDERYGIQALARCALGHDGPAVLAELTRLSPHSPLLGRVRAACKPQ